MDPPVYLLRKPTVKEPRDSPTEETEPPIKRRRADRRRSGRHRSRAKPRPPPVNVHRDTLRFVLQSLLQQPAVASSRHFKGSRSDGGSASGGVSDQDGRDGVSDLDEAGHVSDRDGASGVSDQDGADHVSGQDGADHVSAQVRTDADPDQDGTEPISAENQAADAEPVSGVAASTPIPVPAGSAGEEAEDDPDSALAGLDDLLNGIADPPPPPPTASPSRADIYYKSRTASYHTVRRGPPAGARTSTALPSNVGAELSRLLHRAAQHAASSGSRRQLLEAFQSSCLLLPGTPRLVWQLALCVCVCDGTLEMSRLRAALTHLLRHAGLDRSAVQLTALSAQMAASRAEEALETMAMVVPHAKASRRLGPAENTLLYGAVREWARFIQAPREDRLRRRQLVTLRDNLQALVADQSLRAALQPLLDSVTAELQALPEARPENKPTVRPVRRPFSRATGR